MTFETAYLEQLRHIRDHGSYRMDRTGVGTRAVFGTQLRHDLSTGLPLLTTKRVAWKTAFKEMLWMLGGGNNIRELLLQDVHIWSEWPHAQYVRTTGDNISLSDFERRILDDKEFGDDWGILPNGYGEAWRGWKTDSGERIDQVSNVLDLLRNDPYSRRIMWTGWDVARIKTFTLPPCHYSYQWFVADGRLSGSCILRSQDCFLGQPFNALGLALVTHMLAQQVGLGVGEVVITAMDTHLYSSHTDAVNEQLSRTPRAIPQLVIKRKPDSFFDYRIEDFDVVGYDPHPAIKAPVAV